MTSPLDHHPCVILTLFFTTHNHQHSTPTHPPTLCIPVEEAVELLLGKDGLLANNTRTTTDILTMKSFENAITTVYALGGSTNAVIHLLAIARGEWS